MHLIDVNVLLYALREDAPEHARFRPWLERLIGSGVPFGLSELILSAFIRIATHPSIFSPPTPLDTALEFAETLRGHPNAIIVRPGVRHWDVFTGLLRQASARGNLVPDAYIAALAIENGCELITTDRDFSRFSGLKWRPPDAAPVQ